MALRSAGPIAKVHPDRSTMAASPVLIVGGGPVGLSLALGLARQGVRSTLFEAKSEPDPHSRALGILPRTLEIFRAWGIYERLVLEGTLISKVDFWIVGRDVGTWGRVGAS